MLMTEAHLHFCCQAEVLLITIILKDHYSKDKSKNLTFIIKVSK